ncbi:leucine-rich repeat domain-containing protein [Aureibacter tunicatorum]|uniref:Leucine-rich repeat (LRR) protein n=1 Tax=Aureibacter tunicatorum TaxID=866807 RepID=A0AAE3XTK0_9BACT|nr:leucine-rich repeat domain-containing protein [Aureibacter tunicatorum]MDR6241823.1 Leucine-rich repeat (LRR) protein [Aureibacter tunicatorum]
MKYLIIFFISLLMSCSSNRENKHIDISLQRELEREKKIIEILENKYGFVDIDEKNTDLNYDQHDNGLIRVVYIQNKDFDYLPSEIYQLKHITRLDLRGANFKDLPDSLMSFKNLKELMLLNNPIIRVSEIKIPNSIENIRFDDCPMESFPKLQKENDSIPYKLFLSKTKIDSIPDFVGDMNICLLWANECPITYISPNLGNCENMYEVDFSRIKTDQFPEELGKLSKMNYVKLNRLKLNAIPEFIFEWKNLTAIKLNNNKIREVPEAIGQLKKLKSFYAQSNELTTLPKEFGQLKNIEFIDLEYNVLDHKSFPEEMFFPRNGDKARLYVSRPDCYTCFSVPEEQVRRAFKVL